MFLIVYNLLLSFPKDGSSICLILLSLFFLEGDYTVNYLFLPVSVHLEVRLARNTSIKNSPSPRKKKKIFKNLIYLAYKSSIWNR